MQIRDFLAANTQSKAFTLSGNIMQDSANQARDNSEIF